MIMWSIVGDESRETLRIALPGSLRVILLTQNQNAHALRSAQRSKKIAWCLGWGWVLLYTNVHVYRAY